MAFIHGLPRPVHGQPQISGTGDESTALIVQQPTTDGVAP
jgi:hypothetical protein